MKKRKILKFSAVAVLLGSAMAITTKARCFTIEPEPSITKYYTVESMVPYLKNHNKVLSLGSKLDKTYGTSKNKTEKVKFLYKYEDLKANFKVYKNSMVLDAKAGDTLVYSFDTTRSQSISYSENFATTYTTETKTEINAKLSYAGYEVGLSNSISSSIEHSCLKSYSNSFTLSYTSGVSFNSVVYEHGNYEFQLRKDYDCFVEIDAMCVYDSNNLNSPAFYTLNNYKYYFAPTEKAVTTAGFYKVDSEGTLDYDYMDKYFDNKKLYF